MNCRVQQALSNIHSRLQNHVVRVELLFFLAFQADIHTCDARVEDGKVAG